MIELDNSKWLEIIDFFKNEYDIANVTFSVFIEPLEFISYKDGVITLCYSGQTSSNLVQYIEKKYLALLKASAFEVTGENVRFNIIMPEDKDTPVIEASSVDSKLDARIQESNLDKKYTFDTFVVGANNNAAKVTAMAVAEAPGEIYNPLYIYGGVGLGKTHIIHSIGNHVLANNEDAKVLYTTSENFVNQVIDLLGVKNTEQEDFKEFRRKYRNVDVLLIDDIQFFANKDRCQEELFNIFNDLHMKNKQIVLTSDRLPKDIEDISDRLINRFEMGLSVDMKNPDYETRMAILKNKSKSCPIEIEPEALSFIANNFTTNVRELEGSLNNITAFAKIERLKVITEDFAKSILKDRLDPDKEPTITCDQIVEVVADHFNISKADIKSKKRNSDLVNARQICMYLCRKLTDEKLDTIAKELNKKSHRTVLYSYETVQNELLTDAKMQKDINIITKKIGK